MAAMALIGRTLSAKLLSLPRLSTTQYRSINSLATDCTWREPYSQATETDGGRCSNESVGEDEGEMVVRYHMPGLRKEHVKVCAKDGVVYIHGKAPEADGPMSSKLVDMANGPREYNTEIQLPADDEFIVSAMRTKMENGILTVLLPRRVHVTVM